MGKEELKHFIKFGFIVFIFSGSQQWYSSWEEDRSPSSVLVGRGSWSSRADHLYVASS